jgi:hypothetical protein
MYELIVCEMKRMEIAENIEQRLTFLDELFFG